MTAAAFVLIGFVANDVPIMWLWRPLVVALGVALLIQLPLWRLLGATRGSVWGFIVVASLTGLFVVAGLTLFAIAAFRLVRSRRGREYELVGVFAGVFGLLLIGIPGAIGMGRGTFEWTPMRTSSIDVRTGPSHGSVPNIHLLLLDGYPRADVLARLGFDNGEFLEAMEGRGFDVYEKSLSNYDLTPFSLLSMLSDAHIHSIRALHDAPARLTVAEQQRLVTRALLDAPMFDALEHLGYRTRVLTGGVVLTSIGGADMAWNAGTVTNFEIDRLQQTPFAALLEVFGFASSQHRAHIEASLAEFANVPSGPVFTFAHVLAPHAPFVYTADGDPASSPPCYPSSCQLYHQVADHVGWPPDEFRTRQTAHIQHVNHLVLESIDTLLAQDPDGVVIVLSDHGIFGSDELDRFRNLTMARTPGHADLLGDAPTPINVLPRILNAYLGIEMAELPDTLYRHGSGNAWLEMELVAGESPTGQSDDR